MIFSYNYKQILKWWYKRIPDCSRPRTVDAIHAVYPGSRSVEVVPPTRQQQIDLRARVLKSYPWPYGYGHARSRVPRESATRLHIRSPEEHERSLNPDSNFSRSQTHTTHNMEVPFTRLQTRCTGSLPKKCNTARHNTTPAGTGRNIPASSSPCRSVLR